MTAKLAFALATTALFAACSSADRGVYAVPPSKIGIGPTQPAPTPTLNTIGAEDAPSFGPGVGAGLDTGIGIQPSTDLIP